MLASPSTRRGCIMLMVIQALRLVHSHWPDRSEAPVEGYAKPIRYRMYDIDLDDCLSATRTRDFVDIIKLNERDCGRFKPGRYLRRHTLGERVDANTPLIAGGYTAKPGEFPSYVGLSIKRGTFSKTTCGGTIIHSRIIVTAAHCIDKSREIWVSTSLKPSNLWSRDDVIYTARRSCIAKNFVRNRLEPRHDFAVVVLEKDIPYHEDTQPACLSNQAVSKGEGATAVGNGVTETGRRPASLKALLVEEVSCPIKTSYEFVCFGPRNGQGGDTCGGDSGGPVYVVRDNKQTLVGITSHGPDVCKSDIAGLGIYLDPQRDRLQLLRLINECYNKEDKRLD